MQCALRSCECSGSVKTLNVSARQRGRAKDVLRGKAPYDAPSTISLPICEKHQTGSLYTVGWERIVSGGGLYLGDDGSIKVWRVNAGQLEEVAEKQNAHENGVFCLCCLGDGRIVSVSLKLIKVWRVENTVHKLIRGEVKIKGKKYTVDDVQLENGKILDAKLRSRDGHTVVIEDGQDRTEMIEKRKRLVDEGALTVAPCIVCMVAVPNRMIKRCGHALCKKCITQVKGVCPTCKQPFVDNDVQQLYLDFTQTIMEQIYSL